jgi:hypothetical protein
MFHKGCGINIPADPFRNSGLAAPQRLRSSRLVFNDPLTRGLKPLSTDAESLGDCRSFPCKGGSERGICHSGCVAVRSQQERLAVCPDST